MQCPPLAGAGYSNQRKNCKRGGQILILKITTAGKDPVTTLPAAIANEFIIMRKNINTNSCHEHCHPKLAQGCRRINNVRTLITKTQ